ncbi:hypothetical protein [Ramlibacter sp.]|uniref:hypothetical protein n=1 Tax=Ramlibacter sp. TaxID=1917967 RepID=UPI003D0DDD90
MEGATLQLPKDLVEAAINQHVQIAITQALGGQQKLLAQAVHQVLTQKVDSDGKPGRGYGSDREFITWAVDESLRAAVKRVISEELVKYEDVLRQQISDQLSRKNSPLIKQLAEGVVKGAIDATKNQYSFHVEIKDR